MTTQKENDIADESLSGQPISETKLVRQLKNRHVAMITYGNFSSDACDLLTSSVVSIGGLIGTGEFQL